MISMYASASFIFQLTASRRGLQIPGMETLSLEDISTHSLTKRLTHFHHEEYRSDFYFNSQPHEEADKRRGKRDEAYCSISTHSLTKRLTVFISCFYCFWIISTHSLTKRLTMRLPSPVLRFIFQLTASRRG